MRRSALLALALALTPAPHAHEFRTIEPVKRRDAEVRLLDAARFAAPLAVSQERIDYAMRQVVRTWNREPGGVELAFRFPRRDAVLDALKSRVPRDATLKLDSVSEWRILAQATINGRMRTTVAVIARTRIEFTDDSGRLQAREGVNEYHLTLEDMTR